MNKRIIPILITLFCAGYSYAGRPIKFGGQIGINVPFTSISKTYSSLNANNLTGFHLGPVLELSPTDFLSFNTALLFNYNTLEIKNDPLIFNLEPSTVNKMFSLQLPVLIEARYSILEIAAIYGEAGPYAEVGLLNFTKRTYLALGNDESFKSFDYNKLDYGLKFGFGFELLIFKIGASYSFGFPTHTFDNGYSSVDLKQRMLQIHLAIR